ncbi:MAG: 2-deoxyribose-5-phosphate aldolase [Thermoanaerobaculum sp.]|nr:MAG: 2-deoxyribose-5-phosphate aldolase [Thermoanaerobaculum sp.]
MSEQALRELAAAIDHTLLKPEATREHIRKLCREAREYGFAAVCVNPLWVAEARAELRETNVAVASVVGFPLGATTPEAKLFEARQALEQGATELDVVVSLGLLKGGEDEAFRHELSRLVAAALASGAKVKAILETCLLTEEEKVRAAKLSVEAGVHYLKTSTGFGGGGATVDDVALLRKLSPPHVGVKASGGIRTFAQARAMLAAGATRLGTSSGVAIMEEARKWYGRA